jgi:DNA repair exonuclease SbcCD ATPase subunit
VADALAIAESVKRPSVTETQNVTESETNAVTETKSVSPGERCPTCNRKVPKTGKQRLAALRERERLKKEARAEAGL